MSALDDVVGGLKPISLGELDARAGLMTRVDRKYFVPRAVLAEILAEAGGRYRVLEIGDRRAFRYRSVYFDSPRFGFYRDHVQRRRQRFKVRTRTYCDSGDCLLEVKSKGYRGRTVKERIEHDPLLPAELGGAGADFVERLAPVRAAGLSPVVETVYRRTTLHLDDQRVTCDLDLVCRGDGQEFHGPDDVLVETKTPGPAGATDRALLRRSVRPHSVSKYCVAAALCYPGLPHNPWHRTLRRYFGPAAAGQEPSSCRSSSAASTARWNVG